MDRAKKKRLERKGWKVGTAEEFLKLSPREAALVELKLALSGGVRELRLSRAITQLQLAKLMGSSQSRVAKIEAGDPSVSMDLMVESLFALGANRKDLASILSSAKPRQSA